MSNILIPIIAVAVLLALVSIGAGIFLIVRYARNRKALYLISGLILTFILPGICLLAALFVFIPSTTIVYGPPPNFPTPTF